MRYKTKLSILMPMAFVYLCACITVSDYSRVYFKASESTPGVDPYIEKPLTDDKMRCVILRNQFFVASTTASTHMNWIWGFPLSWPLYVMTVCMWPIHEYQTASAVRQLASELESGYQLSDAAFFSACERVRRTEIGMVFWKAQLREHKK